MKNVDQSYQTHHQNQKYSHYKLIIIIIMSHYLNFRDWRSARPLRELSKSYRGTVEVYYRQKRLEKYGNIELLS